MADRRQLFVEMSKCIEQKADGAHLLQHRERQAPWQNNDTLQLAKTCMATSSVLKTSGDPVVGH